MGNVIRGNSSLDIIEYAVGGGIYCQGGSSSPLIKSNIIQENQSGDGGGLFCEESQPTITGNTITGNIAGIGGGGIYFSGGPPTITNSIFWDNLPDEILGDSSVTYCNVQGGWPGEGNINEDPMFVLADRDDYRLLWGSPCIDSGDPNLFDEDGTRSDMGAHYFDQNDYITLYLTPDATEVLPGEELGVTYTAINRWESPESCWLLSQVLLPGGSSLNVLGPDPYTLPANYTAQVHITHTIPNVTPAGMYEYRSLIGMPPGTLYDEDRLQFTVTE